MQPWDTQFDELLRDCLKTAAPPVIEPDVELIELGLDSMGLVALVISLEETYDLSFPPDAITYATFSTPARIWQYVLERAT